MKKGIGGPVDILHSIVIIIVALFMIKHGIDGNGLGPMFVILFALFLLILEVGAIFL
ncbi:MAG: hypothetical protein V1900_04510 [Candidatus Aenigmatarchaeota archaeon]